MSEWISVEDRQPLQQDYRSAFLTIDVIVTDGLRVGVSTYAIGGNHVGRPWGDFTSGAVELGYITHWMPLPEPPRSE